MATVIEQQNQRAWGPRLDLGDKPDLFAPQSVKPYTPPAPGIDNLGITSTDTFRIYGVGEFEVDFRGFVRVARSTPSAEDWNHSEVYTNLIEMKMIGESPEVGTIVATLNHECLSTGQLWTPPEDMDAHEPEKACRMAVTAYFHVPRLGKVLFNKEPLLLTIENVRMIPPSGNPGMGRIYDKLPLFDTADPDGRPLADITALRFVMGTYLTEEELAEFRDAN